MEYQKQNTSQRPTIFLTQEFTRKKYSSIENFTVTQSVVDDKNEFETQIKPNSKKIVHFGTIRTP